MSVIIINPYRFSPPPALYDLLSDDCEYVDNAAAEAAGWSNGSANVMWGYSTSPAPLAGSRSLRLASGSESVSRLLLSSAAEMWFYAMVRISPLLSTAPKFSFRTAAGVLLFEVYGNSSGNVQIAANVVTTSAGTPIGTGTRHVWIHYLAGSGTNGVIEVFVGSTATRPASPSVATSTATTTGAVGKFSLDGRNSCTEYYDKLRARTTEIESDPV